MRHFCSFSEAIREGAKMRPQTKVNLYDEYGTCALGAGLHAMYGDNMRNEDDDREVFHFDVLRVFPYMATCVDACPHRTSRKWWQFWKWDVCVWGERPRSLVDTITHLNDNHEWKRERIADWLEAEEEKLGFATLIESESDTVEPQRLSRRRLHYAEK